MNRYDEEGGLVASSSSQSDGKDNIEEIKKEVKDLESQIDELCGRLTGIQSSCRHSEKEVKFTSQVDSGRQELRWVCSVCDKVVGYPNPEEVKKFLH